MFCPKCGQQLVNGERVCPNCGLVIVPGDARVSVNDETRSNYVSFGEAIKLMFKKIFKFSGRSSKSEFWWGYLFFQLISLVYFIPYLGWIISIGGIVLWLGCELPLTVRRLHDVGRSGTYFFMFLIPVYGIVCFFREMLRNSDVSNEWGPAYI